nr:MAG TPA: hypothetical protein [Bacteriophage sp.]DAQ60395.1 MAG TPA: hypothetical protein [Bacteriophage sp.]DAU52602.1 MAG TPA: hypothetical protein [Crassvirales sp.]DAV77047.1 MAG TPA: hypothetical protein [Caudoviricetes sp.]
MLEIMTLSCISVAVLVATLVSALRFYHIFQHM